MALRPAPACLMDAENGPIEADGPVNDEKRHAFRLFPAIASIAILP
jgi:hypothetical protein